MSATTQNFWQRLTQRRGDEQKVISTPAVETLRSITLPGIEIPVNDPLYAYCVAANGVVELDHVKLESAALQNLKSAGVKLVLPLVSQGELVGLLSLGERLSEQEYSSDDYRLLNNLSTQAATSLRVAQLARLQQLEALKRERIENELRVAGIIQQTLLPHETPALPGWKVSPYWQPARTVGGDFYDFISLSDGRLALIIGDVTDKGVPAALVMASTRSILRAVMERLTSPGEVLRRANDVLCPDMPPRMFVTCLCAVLDPATGRLEYANAGHNPPYQRTANGVIELLARGMPLGLMPAMSYEEKVTILQPSDSVLLYSDGLVEAHNSEREMFGSPRLQELLQQYVGSEGLIDHLRTQLTAFTGPDWEQEDDVTFLVLDRQPKDPTSDNEKSQTLAEFQIASEPGNEREAMERVAEAVHDLNLPNARLERLKTAVAESTMNAMEHGNRYRPDQPVMIQVELRDSALAIRIIDHGTNQVMAEAEIPDLDAKLSGMQSARGWGLFLIKNMVDDMHVSSDDTRHTVELILNL